MENIHIFCANEILLYRGSVSLPLFLTGTNEFSDPLMWWESSKNMYPALSVLSQRFLSIPATSAPSERLWSLASRIVTIRRARLDLTVIGNLMFSKENCMIMSKHFYNITWETGFCRKFISLG